MRACTVVAYSMELDELSFSSFFMDHGNNNEAKSLSSNFTLENVKTVKFVKWNDTDYGFVIMDTNSKGVQLIFRRTAEAGDIKMDAYAAK